MAIAYAPLDPDGMSPTSMNQRARPHCRRPGRAGQSVVEFAIVASIFAMLLGTILESGRAWGAANVLNAAARDAARIAAVTPAATDRKAVVESRVRATAGSYFAASDLSVALNQSTSPDGEPLVTVSATGKMSTFFGAALFGPRIALTRSVTIRDETLAR